MWSFGKAITTTRDFNKTEALEQASEPVMSGGVPAKTRSLLPIEHAGSTNPQRLIPFRRLRKNLDR